MIEISNVGMTDYRKAKLKIDRLEEAQNLINDAATILFSLGYIGLEKQAVNLLLQVQASQENAIESLYPIAWPRDSQGICKDGL